MIEYIGVLDWIQIIAACILFLGPGLAIVSFQQKFDKTDWTGRITLAVGFSISIWATLFAWLHLFNISLPPQSAFLFMLLGWSIFLIRSRPWRDVRSVRDIFSSLDYSRIILWIALILTGIMAIYNLRDLVVGPGSDTYHHTLIVQIISDTGMLPNNYEPYAPIASFTYHFGFHTLASGFSWMTGLSLIYLVPIVAQLLLVGAALSTAHFTEVITKSRTAATIAGVFTGLALVFPTYLFNWGRYTQLTGLVLLPIVMAVIWEWQEDGYPRSNAKLVALMASGLVFSHYKVALMATLGGLAILLGGPSPQEMTYTRRIRNGIQNFLIAILLTIAFISPWIIHVAGSRGAGFPLDFYDFKPSYFSLDRLGAGVIDFPTNITLLGLAAGGAIFAFLERKIFARMLLIWSILIFVFSDPNIMRHYMDRVSVVISLYVVVALLASWFLSALCEKISSNKVILTALLWGIVLMISIWGIIGLTSIVDANGAFVTSEDLEAMEWIRGNIPEDAKFMVNTIHFEFSEDFIIGIDAGYWLPLLGGRDTITAPMIYSAERASIPNLISHMKSLHALSGDLTTDSALVTLAREGVTHVYVGKRGGPIRVQELMSSDNFELLYEHEGAYVFRFNGLDPYEKEASD